MKQCDCLPCLEKPFSDAAPRWPMEKLQAFANQVCSDPEVSAKYPTLNARPLKLVHSHDENVDWRGRYDPNTHVIELNEKYNGLNPFVLLHEMAHACLPASRTEVIRDTLNALMNGYRPNVGHGPEWRETFLWLAPRFLGTKVGEKLAVAFKRAKDQ